MRDRGSRTPATAVALVAGATALALPALAGCGHASTASGSGPTGSVVVQFRDVRGSGSSPADSSELQTYRSLDCDHPRSDPPADAVVAACDVRGAKYLLGPASVTGEVADAAVTPPAGRFGEWRVTIRVAAEPGPAPTPDASEQGRTGAVLADGRVYLTPLVEASHGAGDLQFTVPEGSRAEAETLADHLDP